jgi:deazaflavin-dependent oxidoreductase (nitroreductase family)
MDLLEGTYEPASDADFNWAAQQVAAYEASGGREANTLPDHPEWPIVVVTSRGAKSGNLRKNPVMRVEHNGVYAAVASKGGTPENPDWYHNFVAHPVVQLQDGPEPALYRARIVEGAERAEWWDRATAVYAPYNEYQQNTDREIPVFVLEPITD